MAQQLDENLRIERATARNDINYALYVGDRVEARDEHLIKRGRLGRAYEFYSDILRDCHCSAILQKRYMEIVSREWEVMPASKSAADKKAADLCRDILKNIAAPTQQREDSEETEIQLGGGFDQTSLNLLSAIFTGFSVGEIIWDQQGKEVRPVEILQKEASRFVFTVSDRGGYHLRLLTWDDMFEGEPIPPRKMIVHRYSLGNVASDPYGDGLASKLFYPTFFKRNAVKFWLIFADKHGSPTAVIKHAKNASAQDKATYKKALQAIAQDAGILLPEGVTVEFLEAARSSTINCYEGLKDFCNEEMSKVVLGETGSTDQSTGGGSRARDEVGNSVRIAIGKYDADLLSDTLNRTLLTWITRLNYGDAATPPTVWRKFPELDEREDLGERIERDKQLFDLGYRITKAKVEEVYGDGYEIEEIKETDDPPLAIRLGAAGMGSFMQYLSQLSQGGIPRENAIATLTIAFGLSQEEAEAIVPAEDAAQPSDPEAAPDVGAIVGDEAGTPDAATPPEVEESEDVDAAPAIELAETKADLDSADRIVEKARKPIQKAVGNWVDQIGAIVDAAESFEEIQSKLLDLYPELSPGQYSEAIANSMAAAHLAGRWEVLQEGGEADLSEESDEYREAIAVLELCEATESLDELLGDESLQFSSQFSDLLEELGILEATN